VTARAWCLVLVIACVLSAGLGAYASHRWDTRSSLPVQIAHHDTQRAVQTVARVDTVYRRDTVRYVGWQTRYDTARTTDTLTRLVHDTAVVYVRRDVADSTVHACRAVLSSCALALAARDTVIAAQRVEIAAERADRPSLLSRVAHDAAWLGAGYVLGRSGLGATIVRGRF